MLPHQKICITCHQKHDNGVTATLSALERELTHIIPKRAVHGKQHTFNWGIHSRCSYGLSCPELINRDNQAKQKTKNLERQLSYVIENGNSAEIARVLQILSGTFPQVYHKVDREYKTRKVREKE